MSLVITKQFAAFLVVLILLFVVLGNTVAAGTVGVPSTASGCFGNTSGGVAGCTNMVPGVVFTGATAVDLTATGTVFVGIPAADPITDADGITWPRASGIGGYTPLEEILIDTGTPQSSLPLDVANFGALTGAFIPEPVVNSPGFAPRDDDFGTPGISSSDLFLIGKGPLTFVAPGPGTLYFGFNEGFLANNSGSYTVFVERQCVPPPDGLLAWWPGDGNFDDIAGGQDGTSVGGVGFAPGKVGEAFILDGQDDFIAVGDLASLDLTGSFTLDAWIRLESFPPAAPTGFAYSGIAVKWDDVGVNERAYHISVAQNGRLAANTAQGLAGPLAGILFSSIPVPLGEWLHVAYVFDLAGTHRLYMNGQVVASAAHSLSGVADSPQAFEIGSGRLGGSVVSFFDGFIDEVEIFNRALSASEIQSIFDAGSAGKCKAEMVPAVSIWSIVGIAILMAITLKVTAARWRREFS